MPIYEYRCSSCGHELEALQKLSEAPLVACPSCNANALVKLVSASGFQLKGSGWYATDFKGGAKPARQVRRAPRSLRRSDVRIEAGSEDRSDERGEDRAKPEAKTETKPATKSESAPPSRRTGGTATWRRTAIALTP